MTIVQKFAGVWPSPTQKWPAINSLSRQAPGVVLALPISDVQAHVRDVSGVHHQGTLSGAAYTFDNEFGWVLKTTADGQYVVIPNHPLLNFNTSPMTITCWLKTTEAIGPICSTLANGGPFNGYEFCVGQGGSTGQTKLALYNGSSWKSGNTAVNDGIWHLVGVTNNGVVTVFYVDGKADGSAAHGSPTANAQNLYLFNRGGAVTANQNLWAQMKDFRILRRALTETEMAALYKESTRWELYEIPRHLWVFVPPVEPPPSGEIFNIHQESDLSEWDSIASDDAIWAAAAGLAGSAGGMQVTIDDTTATYGSKTISLSGLTNIRFRYYIKRTTLAMSLADDFGIIRLRASADPWDLVRMTVTRTALGTGFRLSVTIFQDDTTTLALNFFENFGTGEHYVEVRVQRASSAVASDGEVGFWVDGNYIGGRSDVDNYDLWLLVTAFYAGATSLIDATTSGVFYLDELVMRNDDTAIGPLGILGPIAMYNQLQRLGAY